MASTNPDLTKTPKRRPNPSRKVRLVAKIAASADPTVGISAGESWISVNRPAGEASESVTLSFSDQSASRKESCELDYCYDQYEDNGEVFSREVKPLVDGVLEGCNATVIALGARGSGKTSLIQGSSEKPGLAMLAIDEIISMAERNGCSITISSYEIYQDHIYDILSSLRPEVLVMGDAQGNIRLKGLSQVPVKSTLEFSKLYVSGCTSRKTAPRGPAELPRRCHKGLILYVSSQRENSDTLQVSKLNFIDLAGYEDTRRKNTDCLNHVESCKINKSIYAMIKVVSAVSSNGGHVPYRESKLTHLLQDSLGGMSKVLAITCLKPSFCQDSIYMVSLISRSCQSTNQAVTGSTRKSKGSEVPSLVSHSSQSTNQAVTGSAKKSKGSEVVSLVSRSFQSTNQAVTGSTKKSKGSEVRSSHKGHISMDTPAISKKQIVSRVPLSENKVNVPLSTKKATSSTNSTLKGRKLFEERSRLTKSMKANAISDIVSTIETSVAEKEDTILNVTEGTEQLKSENPSSDSFNPVEPTSIVEKDELLSDDLKHAEHSLNEEEKESVLLDDPKDAEDNSIADKDVPVNGDGPAEEVNPGDDSTCAVALVDELLSDDLKHAEHSLNEEEKESVLLDDPKDAEDNSIADKDVPVNGDGPAEEVNPSDDSTCAVALVEEEKENNNSPDNKDASPPISERLQELALRMKSLCSSTPLCINMAEEKDTNAPVFNQDISHSDSWEVANVTSIMEPKTPVSNIKHNDRWEVANVNSPWETLSVRSTGVKESLVEEYLSFLNTASKEDLKRLKGIGEKRATYILECREESPQPFKKLEDLQDIGLSQKQINNLMKQASGRLFD